MKNLVVYVGKLYKQGKISQEQLDLLLRHTGAYFIELELEEIIEIVQSFVSTDSVNDRICDRIVFNLDALFVANI